MSMLFSADYRIPEWELALNRWLANISDWVASFQTLFVAVGFVVCLLIALLFLSMLYYLIPRSILAAIFVYKMIKAQGPYTQQTLRRMPLWALKEWFFLLWTPVDSVHINGVYIPWPGKSKDRHEDEG